MSIEKYKIRNYIVFALVTLFIISWSILLYQVGPQQIVDLLGVNNSYLLMFAMTLFGGLSTFTAPTFYAVLITLALGGLNPFLLGIVAGLGMTISDSAFFYFGMKGRDVLSGRWEERVGRLKEWFDAKPSWAAPILVFLYTGFSPFPNDPLMIGTALASVSYRRIVPFLFLGNSTFATIIAFVASFGIRI